MSRIFILTPTLVSGDAVSNDALAMARLLESRGHKVQLFADDWNLPGRRVRHAQTVLPLIDHRRDVVIYHHSIGWELGQQILDNTAARTIVKYHNVTPASFFEGFSPTLQLLCNQGRAQLETIARGGHDLFLAASEFNRQEFLEAGSDDARTFVVAPFNQVDELRKTAPDLETLDKYSDGKTNLVMVGNVRPNKGHAKLIEAFAQYYFDFNCHSRLLIVGSEDETLASYSQMLRKVVDLLSLEGAVVFTGHASLAELKSYYLVSEAFVIASEHEGFCVPLAEAMGIKLPIAGYATPAIFETVAGAGIVWSERDAALLAETIDLLVTDETVRTRLAMEGQRRYEERFSTAAIETQFLSAAEAAGFSF